MIYNLSTSTCFSVHHYFMHASLKATIVFLNDMIDNAKRTAYKKNGILSYIPDQKSRGKKKVCTDIVQTYLVSLSWSFLPCR